MAWGTGTGNARPARRTDRRPPVPWPAPFRSVISSLKRAAGDPDAGPRQLSQNQDADTY